MIKYTIAKNPTAQTETKLHNFDSEEMYGWNWNENNALTGCKKLDDFIRCIDNVCKTNSLHTRMFFDAHANTLAVYVEQYQVRKYEMYFNLTISEGENTTIDYTIKVDKIEWKNLVKSMKAFNEHVSAEGDVLTVKNTNHVELKLIAGAVKRHFTKYNLCAHYYGQNKPSSVLEPCNDQVLLSALDKHAKTVVLARNLQYIKKYVKVSYNSIDIDDVFGCGNGVIRSNHVLRSPDGKTLTIKGKVDAKIRDTGDYNWYLPSFYIIYTVNTETGKITWRWNDEVYFHGCRYGMNFNTQTTDNKFALRIDGDWNSYNVMNYDTWYKRFGLEVKLKKEIEALMAKIDFNSAA